MSSEGSGWSGSLEEAMAGLIDHRGKTPKKLGGDWTDDGVPVYSAMHVKDGRLQPEGARRVSWEMYERWMKVPLEAGDVLLTSEAPLGEVAYLKTPELACLGQRLFGLRANPSILNPRYLFYLLQHPSIRNQLLGRSSGTTVKGIRQAELVQVQLDLPSLPFQQAIATLLGAYDDLIENNRRRIEILEEMARLLYREWFVNFRFPGHENTEMMDSELGPLPEGWRVIRFNELVDEIKLSVDESEIPGGSPVVGLEHLPRRSTTLQAWDLAEEVGSRRKVFEMGDILFGKIRPYFHKVVDAPVAGFSSTDAIIFRPRQFAERALCIASSDDFVAFAVAGSNGTKMPRANTELLLGFAVPEPPTAIAREFESLLEPMSSLRNTLAAQIRVLEDARDLLLPRLVSGELDVSELDTEALFAIGAER